MELLLRGIESRFEMCITESAPVYLTTAKHRARVSYQLAAYSHKLTLTQTLYAWLYLSGGQGG